MPSREIPVTVFRSELIDELGSDRKIEQQERHGNGKSEGTGEEEIRVSSDCIPADSVLPIVATRHLRITQILYYYREIVRGTDPVEEEGVTRHCWCLYKKNGRVSGATPTAMIMHAEARRRIVSTPP